MEVEENKIGLLRPQYVVGVSSKIIWWRNTKNHGRKKIIYYVWTLYGNTREILNEQQSSIHY